MTNRWVLFRRWLAAVFSDAECERVHARRRSQELPQATKLYDYVDDKRRSVLCRSVVGRDFNHSGGFAV